MGEVTPRRAAAKDQVAHAVEAVKGSRNRAAELLDRYRDRPLVDLGIRFYDRDRQAAGSLVGSAVAFRLFLFFVPLLLFVVGLAGFLEPVLGDTDVAGAGVGSTLAGQVEAALDQANRARWIALGLGLFGMASAGRALSKTMVAASCLAWQLTVRPSASLRLTGAIVGLVSGVATIAVLVNRLRVQTGVAVAGAAFGAALLAFVAAWLVVLVVLPRRSPDPGSLLPGAVLLAVTQTAMQAASQLYLPGRISRASELYGAIGTTVVVLGWFFILGRAVLLAMVLNAVLYERFGSVTSVIFALPGVRAVARRSAWVRRVFDLPEPADPPPAP